MKKFSILSALFFVLATTNLNAQITADFTWSPLCHQQGDTVCLIDLSTGTPAPNDWEWWLMGFAVNSQSYCFPASSEGVGVDLVVSNGFDTDTIVKYIIFLDNCDSVWPGDVNNDGVANNMDLLDLGLAYGTSGYVRPGATINWVGQAASNWGGCTDSPNFGTYPISCWIDSLPDGTNYKHADTDGNGIINDDDTLAISQNYGFTHLKKQNEGNGRSGDPPLSFIVADTLNADTTVQVEIHLGTNSEPVDSIYGIAFTVNYDPSLITAGGLGFDLSNSWLNGPSNPISVNKNFHTSGNFDAGISRTNQTNVSGYGTIATFNLNITDSLPSNSQTLNLFFSNIKAIDANGNILSISDISHSVEILNTQTGIEQIDKNYLDFSIYPNPTNGKFTLSLKLSENQNEDMAVTLLNLLGQEIYSENLKQISGKFQKELDMSGYPKGVYLLKISAKNQNQYKKIVLH